MTGQDMRAMINLREYTDSQLIALALVDVANAIRFSGKEIGKEGAPGMGAIELLASIVRDAGKSISGSIERIADVNENRT